MAPWAVWLLLALSGVLDVRSCCAYRCPVICRCSADTFQCSRETQLAYRTRPAAVSRLRLIHLTLEEVPTHAFRELVNITRIEISQSVYITKIRRHAFLSLHSLTQVSVQNIKSLTTIEMGAFTDLPMLQHLSISNTGLINFPDFTSIFSLALNVVIEMVDNMGIDFIPAHSFQGITEEYVDLNLVRNGFKEIKSHAFNGTKLGTLVLRENRHLSQIEDDAFEGATGPSFLDVSYTALSSLPAKGLSHVRSLKATSAFALKSLPPMENLAELQEAELTYPSHCCAFQTWREKESASKNSTTACDFIKSQMESTIDVVDLMDDINFEYPDLQLECFNNPIIKCTPKPDAFNPCEDLLGFTILRCLTWIITICAVLGNLAVLTMLLISHHKLTVSRFLMCNLAFADLCMGLYLMLIAFMDLYSHQQYYNHATDWQTGPGCGIAGFLTVFASELSVYTLTVISVERWHTITNAMHVNKRLRMRHVMAIMGAGWGLSLLVGILPLVGVSSYSKVSICLPMDIDTLASQVYVVAMLMLNVVAFIIVCYCYICIYLSVHNPEHSTRHGDTKIAKRMAVLIFTDFVCMAPISFFAISAALRMPLITVSHSKILLILFYPINSLCNPFLYTIFTRAFSKDVCLLLSRCSRCHAGADFYRSQTVASHLTSNQKMTSSRKPRSPSVYAYHIKMKGCFLKKGTTST
ncbi:lutropin-choriogonadotropic hormone receptor-like [Solea solea]|uniref:lutropin-choriogonadotropic hormone receptor-like n=1 Tax=Solea solea TaxID=90069 RepID=UPI00272D837C|nr:lutropin-choriogonadotropic hormone receptor-like [Solea solea]XP_058506874.1 lutropin-choriogonadotropic hormone receptor-like [Solea solea]XP_058506875.1 lutropin-choriogonadotropic hormone receptor-like [Solea solea]XP_058506876.1 lutropin-choriogonadotropic hormone receptor-like [Solea solea]